MENNVILSERSKKWKKSGIGIFVSFLIIFVGIAVALGVIIKMRSSELVWPDDAQKNVAVLLGPALTALMCFAFGLSIFVNGKKMATWNENSKKQLEKGQKGKAVAGTILLVFGIIAFIGIIFVFLFYTKLGETWVEKGASYILPFILLGGAVLGWILAIVGGVLLFKSAAASEALICLSGGQDVVANKKVDKKAKEINAKAEQPVEPKKVEAAVEQAPAEPKKVEPVAVLTPVEPIKTEEAPVAQPVQQQTAVADPTDQVMVTEPVESQIVETEEIIEEIIEEPAKQPAQKIVQQNPEQEVVVEEIIEDDQQVQEVITPVEEVVVHEPTPSKVVKKIIRKQAPVEQPKVIEEIIEEVDDDTPAPTPVVVRRIKRVKKVTPRKRPIRRRTVVQSSPDLAETIAQLQNVVVAKAPAKKAKKRTPAKKSKAKKGVIKNISTNKNGDITITISK